MLLVVLSVAVCLAAAQVWGQGAKPITLKGLTDALKIGGLRQTELVKIIQERGVDFQLTRENEAALKTAGANAELLLAVHDNYRGAPPAATTPPSNVAPPAAPPAQPVVQMPSQWTLTSAPIDFKIQITGDYVLLERTNLPMEVQSAGGFVRLEFSKSGTKWAGKSHSNLPCMLGFGQFARPKMCSVESDASIVNMTPYRIEGTQANWEKFDCRKCEPKNITQAPFVLVPRQ